MIYVTGWRARFGSKYPGRLPGQNILNLLYYFTEEGDLILDPFAGSGTTIDAVKFYGGRKVLAYDLRPTRPDINNWDVTEGLPPEAPRGEVKLIILDPPY